MGESRVWPNSLGFSRLSCCRRCSALRPSHGPPTSRLRPLQYRRRCRLPPPLQHRPRQNRRKHRRPPEQSRRRQSPPRQPCPRPLRPREKRRERLRAWPSRAPRRRLICQSGPCARRRSRAASPPSMPLPRNPRGTSNASVGCYLRGSIHRRRRRGHDIITPERRYPIRAAKGRLSRRHGTIATPVRAAPGKFRPSRSGRLGPADRGGAFGEPADARPIAGRNRVFGRHP